VSGCSSWGIGGGSGQAARNSTIRWNSDPAAPAGPASGACQPEAQWEADPSQAAPRLITPCKGFGSGFFISERGDILTSAHVVEGCSRLAVRGPSGRVYAARIASTDGAYDLAILKVDGEVPATAVLGAEAPLPSAPIAVVGFPETQASLGGATSGVGQILPPENYTQNRGLIVFNANLARGNSGGPIVDTKGQVVGIVFARYNPAPGVFFGVGSETMRRFLDRHAVGYHMARVSPPAGFDEIIRSAIAYTVYVQCLA
jgi:S1-C subfamily serine protease